MEVIRRRALPFLAILTMLAVPAIAFAQQPTQPQAQPQLEPPKAITATTVEYPADAPPHDQPVVVRVKLTVDAQGDVKKVELLSGSLPVFDDAVVKAAEKFKFHPARYGGKPVPVAITFTHTFLPPPPKPKVAPDGGPPLTAALRGRLVEKGTRAPVSGATVAVLLGGKRYAVDADARGRFRLPLPSGEARVTVHVAGYKAFLQTETIVDKQEVAVAYYIERERYDPYEILVYGERRREEISRITLRGAEIKQVPGTFGDPFRVISTLPGVTSMMSLLPFPVVRGASPGSTGLLVDNVRVPLLYHLLAGPSVIHPEFIDEVEFYPGGAPVTYGGYTAGIVDGRTRRARNDEHLIDLDANLLQAGGLVRQPVPLMNGTVTAAARYGYPGMILSLATDQASLSYWDYQLRFDGGNPRNGYTIFAYGANDTLETPAATADPTQPNPPLEPSLVLSFHRLDLRVMQGSGRFDALYRIIGGVDDTLAATNGGVRTYVVEPRAKVKFRQSEQVELVAGIEGYLHDTQQLSGSTTAAGGNTGFNQVIGGAQTFWMGGALTEALWRPTERWLIRPGVRVDMLYDGTTRQTSVDPRLTLRYRLHTFALPEAPTPAVAEDGTPVEKPRESPISVDDRSIFLKGGVGVFHQPPRFFLPLPGLDTLALKYGLLRAIQSSLGVEIPIDTGLSLNAEAFYNDMNPLVFDLDINKTVAQMQKTAQDSQWKGTNETGDQQSAAQRAIDNLFAPQLGRAYGMEFLARRKSKSGPYGWIAYTLSLSERKKDGVWAPYDFDRTHILNLVAGVPLPRNWDIGVRLQYQSGKPATTTYGYNAARTEGYFRVDLRIDKRAVWKKWLLDFYIDLTNVALFPEEVMPGQTIRYVLPTFGLRGRL